MSVAPTVLEQALSHSSGYDFFAEVPDLMGAFREAERASKAKLAHDAASLLIGWLDRTAFDAEDRQQFLEEVVTALYDHVA